MAGYTFLGDCWHHPVGLRTCFWSTQMLLENVNNYNWTLLIDDHDNTTVMSQIYAKLQIHVNEKTAKPYSDV